MNQTSEQIRSDLSLDLAKDQPLSPKKIEEVFELALGKENTNNETIAGRKVFKWTKRGFALQGNNLFRKPACCF